MIIKVFYINKLYLKSGFKGIQGEFTIKNNSTHQKLNIYKK